MAWGGGRGWSSRGNPISSYSSGSSTKTKVSKPTYTSSQKSTIRTGGSSSYSSPKSKPTSYSYSYKGTNYTGSSPTAAYQAAQAATRAARAKAGFVYNGVRYDSRQAAHDATLAKRAADKVKATAKLGTGDKGNGRARLPNGKYRDVSSYFGAPISTKTGTWNGGKKTYSGRSLGKPITSKTNTGGSGYSGGGSGGGGGGTPATPPVTPPVVPPKKVAPPVKKAPPKKVAPPVKKVAPPKIHKLKGRKLRIGKFKTLRKSGPRYGLSMTPERLQAAARQRIVNYH